jgi:hypothetical protein
MLDSLTLRLRNECLRALCKICGRQALLPRSLRQIPPRYDPSERPLNSGGFADVWMGEYEGRKVAVKVLRVYSTSKTSIRLQKWVTAKGLPEVRLTAIT